MASVPRQLALFAVVLAALFAAGYAAGRVVDADPPGGGGKAAPHAAPSRDAGEVR